MPKKEKLTINFPHYIRNSKRKAHSSIVPLLKEAVDNSRDAGADNVYFNFWNHKNQGTISDSGGALSYCDDGRGFPHKKNGNYDFQKVMSLYGDQQNITAATIKSGQNGIGMKDFIEVLGNEAVIGTKSSGKEPAFLYRNVFKISFEDYQELETFSYGEIIQKSDVPKYIKEEISRIYEELSWKSQESSGSLIIIGDTKQCSVDGQEQNNFWSSTTDYKAIDKLVKQLKFGIKKDKKQVYPLCMFYPVLNDYKNPDIWINGEKLFKVTNLEAVYRTKDGKLAEAKLDHPDFDEDANRRLTAGKKKIRSSAKRAGTKQNDYLLLDQAGKILIRGGTVVGIALKDKGHGWIIDANFGRNSFLTEFYADVCEFDEFYKLDQNKRPQISNLFENNPDNEHSKNIQRALNQTLISRYQDGNQKIVETDKDVLTSYSDILGEYHKKNYVVSSDGANKGSGGSSNNSKSSKSTSALPQNTLRGWKVIEKGDIEPDVPYTFEKSKNGNAFEISIYLQHPEIINYYSGENQQLSYIIDVYAKGMMKENDFADYCNIKDEVVSLFSFKKDKQ